VVKVHAVCLAVAGTMRGAMSVSPTSTSTPSLAFTLASTLAWSCCRYTLVLSMLPRRMTHFLLVFPPARDDTRRDRLWEDMLELAKVVLRSPAICCYDAMMARYHDVYDNVWNNGLLALVTWLVYIYALRDTHFDGKSYGMAVMEHLLTLG